MGSSSQEVCVKVLVLGGSGMLGHQLCARLSEETETWASFRTRDDRLLELAWYSRVSPIFGVEAGDLRSVETALDTAAPDVVLNAIGIVKQRDESKDAIPAILVNALFPHELAGLTRAKGIGLVHVSTDCVFSGLRGMYTEADVPDPTDLYGRTKLLGEVLYPGCLTLRTSIVGWELRGRKSLLEWFAAHREGRIKGYRRAIYTGLSSRALAELIADLLLTRKDLSGLYHVASAPISKYEILHGLADRLGWKSVTIEPSDQFRCDRSLLGARFEAATGWQAPSWEEMLDALSLEWLGYSQLRR